MKNILYKLSTIALGTAMAFGASQVALADNAYRDARFASFKPLPICQEGDIVFVGNSITDMLDWQEATGAHYNVHSRGNVGCYAEEIRNNLAAMVTGNPSKVFLMIGTNNLGDNQANTPYHTTPENVIPIIKETLLAIRKQAPNADVYYQTILPTVTSSAVGTRTPAKTEATNNAIKDWINQLGDPKLHFIDLYSHFLGQNGYMKNDYNGSTTDDAWTVDHLHLSQKGYRAWLQILQDVGALPKEYAPVFPENAPNLWAGEGGATGMRNTYFGAMPVTSNDILILGDGIANMATWSELLGSADFKSRAQDWGYGNPRLSYLTVNNLTTLLKTGNTQYGVKREDPKGIILYAGIGEIRNSSSATSVFSTYQSVVNNFRQVFPNTPIFVCTLAAAKDANVNSRVNTFNTSLRQTYGSGNDKVHVIDINTAVGNDCFLTDADKQSYGTYSSSELTGLTYYLSGKAFVKMAQAIAAAVNPVLSTSYRAVTDDEMEKTLRIYDILTGIYNGDPNAGNTGKKLTGEQVTYFTDTLFPEVAAKLNRKTIDSFFTNLEAAYNQARTVEGSDLQPVTVYVDASGHFYSYTNDTWTERTTYQYNGTWVGHTGQCNLVARWVSDDGLVKIQCDPNATADVASNNLFYFKDYGFIACGPATATVANPYYYTFSAGDDYELSQIHFVTTPANGVAQNWIVNGTTYTTSSTSNPVTIDIQNINAKEFRIGLAGNNQGAMMTDFYVVVNPEDYDFSIVEDVAIEDNEAPLEYFTLQGIKVAQPAPGNIYIIRQGTTVRKTIFR